MAGKVLIMEVMEYPTPFKRTPRLRRGQSGFTLVEVVFAGALLVILVAGSFITLTQINRWATSARLRTLALAMAQQRIDAIQTAPWQVGLPRPTILTAGTTTENNLPLNNDAFNNATSLASPYTALDVQVIETRTTQITDLTARTLRATVTVTFNYRSRPHTVTLTTMRTTDSI
jgi:type II secretory pathway pseudopilin PulG